MSETHRGRYHPETLKAPNNLGGYLITWQSQTKGLPVLEDSLKRHQKVLGEYHQHTLIAEQSIGVSYFHQGKFDKAIEVFENVLPRLALVVGETNEATVHVRANLGINYLRVGRTDDALRLLEEAYSKRLPSHDLSAVAILLFNTCMQTGKIERAREIAITERDELNERSPDAGPERLVALWPVANRLLQSNMFPEAESCLRECLQMREQYEAGDWKLYDNQSVLGEALLEQGKIDEAAELILSGYEGLAKTADAIPRSWRKDHVPQALQRLMELHRRRKEPDKVKEYAAKLLEYEASIKE